MTAKDKKNIKKTKADNIFTNKSMVVVFAVIAMFSWGCAFPFIKIGMREFAIAVDDTAGKMLFAGVRFLTAGIITLIISFFKNKDVKINSTMDFLWLILYGAVNTGFHYFCFYMGLSNCSGSKASIIDSLGTFWLIFLAAIIFKEKINANKIAGCILGFSGIVIANFTTDLIGGLSFNGEGFLLISTFCAAFGGVITRVVTVNRKISVIKATGYGLSIGGIMLLAGGIVLGGSVERITLKGVFIMAGLVCISVIGFVLYNQLLSYNPVGEIAIFNALIPVFGTLTSCILTGEKFYFKYTVSIILVAAGIWFVNRDSFKEN